MSRPRVLLADDHRIVAEGLKGILDPEFELVGIVEDGRSLVEAAEKKVEEWRERGELYLPDFPEDTIRELRGTLRYPPEGSTEHGSK
jgi:CheY-like chemotaxis protein